MTHDDCPRMEGEISALLDGEMTAPEAAAVEAHVRACPSCAVLARDLAGVGRTLRTWESEEPEASVSPGFRSRLLSEVAAERRSARPGAPRPAADRRGGVLLSWLVPAAAAAALVLASSGLLLQENVRERETLREEVPGFGAPSARSSPFARATVGDHLRQAETHRQAGNPDLERRSVLAAYGLAPSDPEVRRAFSRSLGFDPAEMDFDPAETETPRAEAPARTAGAAPATAADAPDAGDGQDPGAPGLWVGSWKFEAPGAYDDYLSFRDRQRELEIAAAAREVVGRAETATVAAVRPSAPKPDPLSRTLASLSVGAPVGGDGSASYQGIVVFPLRAKEGFRAAPDGEAALGFEEALHPRARRALVVDTPGRSDGSVLVSNLDRGRDLLVLAGQVLEGGRADRMVARDVLVPAGARNVAVPVYDVEAGSGSAHPYGSRFRGVAGMAGARLRALALAQAAPAELRVFVRGRLDLLDVTSLRRSLAGAYDERGPAAPCLRGVREQLPELLLGLRDPDVVGFAVSQGRDLLSLEVFGSHALLVREAPRVLEGCALEALTYAGGGLPPSRGDVAAMLAAAGRGAAFRGSAGEFPEVGFLAAEGGLLGSGVAKGESLLHATVLRGAASGALAGRPASGGDLPGTTGRPVVPAGKADSGSGEEGEGDAAGGSSGPAPSGSDGTKPKDPPSPDQRPR